MNLVKQDGNSIGALAIVAIDNPMAAGTGHRICNDCMKSCIFQKQEPVDIPQVETRTLKDVLELPWGFEIYSLLTRWNPLNFARPLPQAATGYKVLVVGLGPAGFTLSHHLMNDGHTVAAVDGLKIEPLPEDISGVTPLRRARAVPADSRRQRNLRIARRPRDGGLRRRGGIRHHRPLEQEFPEDHPPAARTPRRVPHVRRRALRRHADRRRARSRLGFDHVALCAGAGRPTVIPMKNGLARGVRQASDFLMALQLTGAAKSNSLANLQLRMPIVVIGGGLTAIDTATESLAYYVVQVEKFLERYETLAAEKGEAEVARSWTPEEAETADEFLAHARAIRAERAAAAREGREPNLIDLLNSWGGVTIAYRRRMIDAPSYTLNHEEVAKALEEGVRFAEMPDAGRGGSGSLRPRRGAAGSCDEDGKRASRVRMPAQSILVAAGTQPNTVLAREDPTQRVSRRQMVPGRG